MSGSQRLIDPDKLRARRIRAGLDRPSLAARAGLNKSFISLIERGQRGVSVQTLHKFAEVLDCDIDDLMPEAAL